MLLKVLLNNLDRLPSPASPSSAPWRSRRPSCPPPERLPGGDGHRPPPPASPLRSLSRTPARAWRGAACALAAAFALLLGAVAAEAAVPRDFYAATVSQQLLRVYFNEHLNPGSEPAASAFQVTATSPDGTIRPISGFGSGIHISGVTVTVSLDVTKPVREGDTLTVSYSAPPTNPLQYVDGQGVQNFSGKPVTNETDATKPNVIAAELNGTELILYFDDRMKASAAPDRFAFWIQRGGSGQVRPFGNPRIDGSNTLRIPAFNASNPAKHGETVRFAYTPPSNAANRIQDRSGNQLDAIAQWADIDNQTPPAPSSAAVNGAKLVVTFDGGLEEDPELLPPRSAFRVWRGRSGSNTAVGLVTTNPVAVRGTQVTLSLAEAVLRTDTVTLHYQAPTTGGRLRDDDKRELPVKSFQSLGVTNNTPATTAPQFSSAEVNRKWLEVIFNETLQTAISHRPPHSAFTVTAKPLYGTARTIPGASEGNVAISGSTLSVTLDGEVERGERVTVSYTPPSTNKLRGTDNNDVASFGGQPAANNTAGAPAPTFESASYSYRGGGITVHFDGPFLGCAAARAWRFKVDGGREQSPQVVRCGDRSVLLVLAALTQRPAVEAARDVTVGYNRSIAELEERSTPHFHPPRGSPGPSARLRGTDGSAVASFTDQTVTGLKPRLASASPPTVDGRTLTLTFDEELDPGATPGPWLFHVAVNGDERYLARSGGVAIAGKTVRLTLRSPVAPGDTVTVRYAQPSRCHGHCAWGLRGASHIAVDTFPDQAVTNNSAAPVFASAVVVGKTLTLTFDRNLDPGSKPAPGAFHVTVNNARRSVVSNFGVAIAGKTVRLTLRSAVSDDDTVKVRYTRPSSRPLRSTDGFAVETFAEQEVANNPAVTIWSAMLTVTRLEVLGADYFGCGQWHTLLCSNLLTDDSFTYGDRTIHVGAVYDKREAGTTYAFYVKFDQVVSQAWTLHVGDRQLPVANATLTDGDKTAIWNTTSLGWTNNQQVSLRLTTSGSGTSGGSGGGSGLIAGDPPWVTEVSVASGAGADKTYGLGDTVRVQVDFVEAVEVTGTPRLKIDMDPADWGEKWAAYESGSGTRTLIFAHTVVEPNLSTQGIAVLANSLALNGGTVRAGGADANLAHDGLDHDANHKVNWQTASDGGASGTDVDDPLCDCQAPVPNSGPPTVTGVSVVSSPASGDTYLLGETIRIRASFSDAVNVTGSPRLSIDMDPAAWGTKQAAYASGGGTSSLDFVHTVVEPNFSTQGIAVLANSLALNGGTIRSAAANANAALAHTGLGHDSGHKVDWRPTISVADARANEAAGAKVAFQVSLSRAFTSAGHRVTVDYATSDGTAKAGADYTATSGTLTFAAGETSKTVNVPIIDDSHDEGEEAFGFRLSNATGARIGDGEATGTIVNADPARKAWIARLGRTVADQVIGAVDARMAAPRTAGSEVTVGGQRIALDASADGGATGDAEAAAAERTLAAWLPHADSGSGDAGPGLRTGWAGDPDAGNRNALQGRSMTERELLLGSSFSLAAGDAARSGRYALWGRGSVSRFDGREGGLTVDGEVASAFLGADWSRERTTLGLMLGHSIGDGGYRSEAGRGTVSSTLTGLYPWVRQALGERLSLWGVAGYGEGTLTVTPANEDGTSQAAIRTDLELAMGAVGLRGTLVQAPDEGGFELAVKTDAMGVRTRSASVPGLAGASAEVTRLRLGLEGSRPFRFEGGAELRPSVEVGVRQDGGDAETGFGVDVGGGIAWTDPQRGLSVDLRGRGLVSHDSKGFREAGLSGSLSWVPDAESGRGPSLTLTQTMGGQASGGADALLRRGTLAGLAANDNGAKDGGLLSRRRLEVRFGYGFAAFGDRFTSTPELGFGLSEGSRDYRLGWRLGLVPGGPTSFELGIEANRTEPANDNGAGTGAGAEPEHSLMFRGAVHW